MKQRFLNAKETATYLGVTEHTIRAWRKKGYLSCVKFGRAVRFDLMKIESWIKSKERPCLV